MTKEGRYRDAVRLGAVAIILAVTVVPAGGGTMTAIPPACLICGTRGTAEFLLNVALFLPLGASLVWPRGSRRDIVGAMALGGALSLAIELAQVFIPGRYASLGDLVANTAGAGIGGGLEATSAIWLRPGRRRAVGLSLAWAAVVAAITGLFAFLLEPDLPAGRYYVQWSPVLGQFEHFGGRVLSARLGDVALEPRQYPPPAARRLAGALARGPKFEARLAPGPKSSGLAAAVTIFDGEQREIFVVGRRGDDLVVRLRRRADAARLDRPELVARGLFSGLASSDTATIDVSADTRGRPILQGGSGLCARLDGAERCGLGYPAGRSWALLLALNAPARVLDLLDAAWMALLFLPIGWWAGRQPVSWLAALLAGLAVLGVSAVSVLRPADLVAVGGMVFGLGAGWTLWRRDGPARTFERRSSGPGPGARPSI